MIDLDPLLRRVAAILERHRAGRPGAYRRFTQSAGPAGPRSLDVDPYGCADAANLLYTLRAMPGDTVLRADFVRELGELQNPRNGFFEETTHHRLHTTAHCLAALELFDAGAPTDVVFSDGEADPSAVEPFLESLDWAGNPWIESHRGAGLFAALLFAGRLTPAWQDRYFAWLDAETDPESGLLRRGALAKGRAGDPMRFPALAGTFHYLFNQQYAQRPHPHPEALVDTCLDLRARRLFPLASFVGFAEVDWVYCLNRAVRQSGHRFAEAREAMREFAAEYFAYLDSLDPDRDPGLDDLHALFGAVCALAELQAALPGELRSERPLRLVLDRRPFI